MAGRIRIGPYQPLDTRTPAVPGGGYIKVDASAGRFAVSPLAQLGLGVAESAVATATVMAEQFGRDNEAAVKDADVRLGEAEQALLFDPQRGYLNTRGETALTKAPEVLDAYSKAQEREVESLPDDTQRRMLEDLARRRLTTFSEHVERHSAAERLRWHDEASEQRIAQMRVDAGLHWSDDALLRRALGTTRAEVRDKAERHGWNSVLTDTALRQQTSRTLVSAVETAVDHDPERAQSLRKRYDKHIEAADRVALDALLSEAQLRQRAEAASTEILNAAPPDGALPTPQWRLSQAEAIADPDVRIATIRRLQAATAADEARARTLAEQVLARVLKDGLTDSSQIPVREWVALDAERREAIETRLDHNAAGTEPAPNPALIDELATQMTQAPSAFARHDLVPAVASLPLPQWQRFRDWQAGLRRNDPATEDHHYAIKRGLQLANKMLPADASDEDAMNFRADLVEEIDTSRKINGKSPDDAAIADMLKRHVPIGSDIPRTLLDPREQADFHNLSFGSDSTTYRPSLNLPKRILELAIVAEGGRALNEAIRSAPKDVLDDTKEVAAVTGLKLANGHPSRIKRNGEDVYFNPQTGRYLVRNKRGGPGYWAEFDERGEFVGVVGDTLVHSTPRDQLSPKQVKEWTQPEVIPQSEPMPLLPGSVPASPPKWQEGLTIAPPSPPLPGFSRPEIEIPPYYERRVKRWNDNEPWEEHHHIPQELWEIGRQNRIKFSDDAVGFFRKQTVVIPKDEHWSDLHGAYNKAARKALMKYLQDNKKPGETEEAFASRMTKAEAEKCYKYMINAILNPERGLKSEEKKIAGDARKFLENVSEYVRKRDVNKQ